MYVYLQKKSNDIIVNTDSFKLVQDCKIPTNSKVVVINFRKQVKENISCCKDFHIFQDESFDTSIKVDNWNINKNVDMYDMKSTDDMQWFQSSYVVKGFKDCIVNGSSISNTWIGC